MSNVCFIIFASLFSNFPPMKQYSCFFSLGCLSPVLIQLDQGVGGPLSSNYNILRTHYMLCKYNLIYFFS